MNASILMRNTEDSHEGHEEFEVFHLEWTRVELPYSVFSWILVTILSKIGYNYIPLLKFLPESSIMILFGLLIGLFTWLIDLTVVTLSPDVFFLVLLPPIIMEAGYFMPNRLFFDQLGTILLMAVVGTVFNMFTIGFSLYGLGKAGLFGPELKNIEYLEVLLFGSLIAAVDPVAVLAVFQEIKVDEVLNIIVFGESLLNDGVAVVLFKMFEQFEEAKAENVTSTDLVLGLASFLVVAGGGTLIGIICGFVCAFTTRFMKHLPLMEALVVITMAYLSYLTAEIFHMSGILAITFCGITMKNYVEKNIGEKSSTTVRMGMHTLANVSEMTIFLFIGIVAIRNENHLWNGYFIIATLVCCAFWRIVGVLILSKITNLIRIQKINNIEQIIMMYGGLRGGVAFALVLDLKSANRNLFITTTIAMVFFTVFFQGITIKPLVRLLKVKTRAAPTLSMGERLTSRMMDLTKHGIGEILGDKSEIPLMVRHAYKRFDKKFLSPILLREYKEEPKFLETYQNILMSEALSAVGKTDSGGH